MTIQRVDWASLLLDFRRSRGLKQAAAAELFGVSQGTISRWEAGAAAPTAEIQNALYGAARRERSPLPTLRWAEVFRRMLVPGMVTSQDNVVDIVSHPLAKLMGVPATALEGLTFEEALVGEAHDIDARLDEHGFFAGRIASYEATIRLELNPQIRPGVAFDVHYVGWPHFGEDGRIASIHQGVVVSRGEAAEIRSRLGGIMRAAVID